MFQLNGSSNCHWKEVPHHGLSLIEMSHHNKSAEAFRVLKPMHKQKIDVVQPSKQQNKDRLFLG